LSNTIFNQILSSIIDNSNMDKKEIISLINKNQAKHRGILPEVEALIVARNLDIDIHSFIEKVEDRIIEKSSRGKI
tara:strand:+ start:937 stop:1164 length:228 start_codon:yes stop_codon:yes gene_type:complete